MGLQRKFHLNRLAMEAATPSILAEIEVQCTRNQADAATQRPSSELDKAEEPELHNFTLLSFKQLRKAMQRDNVRMVVGKSVLN
jgi:hypothetical protein